LPLTIAHPMLLMVPWAGLGAARPQGLWRDIMLMMHPLVR